MEKDIAGLKCALTALASTDPQQDFSSMDKVGGMKLQAIIGRSKGKMTKDDRYEIESILQDYSTGWITFSSAYRTKSRNISSPSYAESGKNLYIETIAQEEGARFYDPQGFYRELLEQGYSLVDSRIEMKWCTVEIKHSRKQMNHSSENTMEHYRDVKQQRHLPFPSHRDVRHKWSSQGFVFANLRTPYLVTFYKKLFERHNYKEQDHHNYYKQKPGTIEEGHR